ncbi:hypothetical protein [Hymenobacter sp. GOD-10R]|nr:hypothetical protein [Hymenobacter sp. GOD-10R]WRQ31815.1 hypothetical protein SD425_28620 [Hymenobacter sp. GOD-10R]
MGYVIVPDEQLVNSLGYQYLSDHDGELEFCRQLIAKSRNPVGHP